MGKDISPGVSIGVLDRDKLGKVYFSFMRLESKKDGRLKFLVNTIYEDRAILQNSYLDISEEFLSSMNIVYVSGV